MDYSSSDGVLETSSNIQATLDILHGTSDDMALDSLHGTSDDMASDTMASDNRVQIKEETNLHKGKLIWVGRNMQTTSRIRVVPPVRIDMAKKKLIWGITQTDGEVKIEFLMLPEGFAYCHDVESEFYEKAVALASKSKNQPMMQGNCVKCQTKKSGFVKRKQDHEFSGTDSPSPMS
ncbi:hypothetical protein TNCV_4570681 [Trichonephila clavipes]|nr:hypothetical protein TNCV_4570681 [Trichonephila clavipes]